MGLDRSCRVRKDAIEPRKQLRWVQVFAVAVARLLSIDRTNAIEQATERGLVNGGAEYHDIGVRHSGQPISQGRMFEVGADQRLGRKLRRSIHRRFGSSLVGPAAVSALSRSSASCTSQCARDLQKA